MLLLRKSFLIWFAVIAGSLLLGGIGGKLVSNSVRSYKENMHAQARVYLQTSVLEQMETLEVGDTLRDHVFEDLDLKPVRLRDVLLNTTIISVLDPGCEACLEEVAMLQHTLADSILRRTLIFISGGNPRYLSELMVSTNLPSMMLYDHHSLWLGSYKVITFPFNIVVDTELVVQRIIIGQLTVRDLKSLNIEILQES
jgi:ABC-type uncharacterized transport system ATPase component